jgi:hypothetical protein
VARQKFATDVATAPQCEHWIFLKLNDGPAVVRTASIEERIKTLGE